MECLKREEIFEYVKKQYGTVPEYLWKESPESAVLRHQNGKWYAVLMQVEKSKLGLEEDTKVDILDVKCDPDMVGLLTQTYGFLPGYHMNKKGVRENRAFIYPLCAIESMLSRYPLAGSDLQNRCITDSGSDPSPEFFQFSFLWHSLLPDRAS